MSPASEGGFLTLGPPGKLYNNGSLLPPQGVLDRFSQIQPKLIFSVEAVVYNGKEHNHMDKLQRVVKGSWAGVGGGVQGQESRLRAPKSPWEL